jgi:adenosylcobinamide-phosphate synthase
MFFHNLHWFYPLITLYAAFILDLIGGDPPNRLHPTCWMGTIIQGLWNRMPTPDLKDNPGSRKEGTSRYGGDFISRARARREFAYGVLIVITGLVVFTTPAAAIVILHIPWYWLWTFPVLKATFTYRSLARAAKEVYTALVSSDLAESRRLVGYHLVSRPTKGLTPSQVASAAIESVAENVTDSFTSPVLYFLIFGLPGALGYRYINTADAMIAYRDPEHEYGGKFTAWCDTALNWLPARITGVLMCAAAGLCGADAGGAWRCMIKQHGVTASPNAGWTMAAMAGALGVTLEKKEHYLLEGGAGKPAPGMIPLSLKIVAVTVVLSVILLAALSAAARTAIVVFFLYRYGIHG